MNSIISILTLTALASAESLSTVRSVKTSTLPCPTCVSMPSVSVIPSGLYPNSTVISSGKVTDAPASSVKPLLPSATVILSDDHSSKHSDASNPSVSAAPVDASSAKPVVSKPPRSTVYDTETLHTTNTLVNTVTSCDSLNLCTVITQTEAETTVTTTVNGIETIYTTYCPLSETSKSADSVETSSGSFDKAVSAAPALAESTVLDINKVIVTVTSCSNGKCSEAVSTQSAAPAITSTGTVNVIPPQISTVAVSHAGNATNATSAPAVEMANAAASNKAAGSALFLGVAAMLLL